MMYTVKEASIKLGISERRIRKLLAEGRLKGRRLPNEWFVFSLEDKRKGEEMKR